MKQTPLRMNLEPKTYQLVKITADQTFSKTGELSLIWTSWRGETRVAANVLIKSPEKGVSSSIIQAGNYRSNPFYGVPVYLHYVSKDKADELFGTSDREGNLLLSLTEGAASFMILIYPNGPLPEDGLTLNVEAYQNGTWPLHSQNRLQP